MPTRSKRKSGSQAVVAANPETSTTSTSSAAAAAASALDPASMVVDPIVQAADPAVQQLLDSVRDNSGRLDRVMSMVEGVMAHNESLQHTVSALDSRVVGASEQAAKVPRLHDEIQVVSTTAPKFQAIQSIHCADPATDAEIARDRFASAQFHKASVNAQLAVAWIRSTVAQVPGATEAASRLDEAVKACELGARGAFLGALAVEKTHQFGTLFSSVTASTVLAKEVPEFDLSYGFSPSLTEAIKAKQKDVDNEAKFAERQRRFGTKSATSARGHQQTNTHQSRSDDAPSSFGNFQCYRCHQYGHFARDCPNPLPSAMAPQVAGPPRHEKAA